MHADLLALRAALEGFEERLWASGAPTPRQLRAGLSTGEIDVFTKDLPFRLSAELHEYFAWHDGAEILEGPESPWFPNRSGLNSLAQCVTDYWYWRESPAGIFEYEQTWLPINNLDNQAIVIDCAVGPGEASPIHVVGWESHGDWAVVKAPSVLALVQLWNRMLDEGYWTWDPDVGEWADTWASIPSEFKATELI